MPPRFPVASDLGTSMVRSWACWTKQTPSGSLWLTTARATKTPLALVSSIHSLSETPMDAASPTLSQACGPPRPRLSMNRLSWYSEWIDHLLCTVR